MSNELRTEMFGGFSMTHGESGIGDAENNSTKVWNLLAYLIAYKHRKIPHEELIKVLWEDDENIQNPLGALKALVHRTREMLGELGFDGRKLVLGKRGSYYWSCDEAEMYVDTETFEHLCRNAEKMRSDKSTLPDLLKAIELYKGDFLPNLSSEAWVMPLSVYYSNKYISIVYSALDILSSQERYEDILELCRKAITIMPYEEPLNAQLIDALVHLGRYQLALNHYRQVTDMMYQQFAIAPSDEFLALYREIVKKTNLEETCISDISEKIKNGAPDKGAYYCNPPVFQEICQYDFRTKMRNGRVAFLCLVTVRAKNDEKLEQSVLSNTVQELHTTIRDSLRCGDCFSQLSASQFGILLQDTTYEKGRMVLMRIMQACYRRCPEKRIKMDYSLKQLDLLRIQEKLPGVCAE